MNRPAGRPAAPEDGFEAHRTVLFTLAYEMLGSAAAAEDVVQETWLRRQRIRQPVARERALLCRIATRLALDELRSAAARRERYPGPWLPEPIATGTEVEHDAILAEAVSQATLVVLDTLSPAERAAFLLTEVFGFSAEETGRTLERSAADVRQLARRARDRLRERRRHRRAEATPQLWAELSAAIRAEDVAAAVRLLTPGAVLTADGGGTPGTARRPVSGAEAVARFLIGIAAKEPAARLELAEVNGQAALLARIDGRIELLVSIAVHEGRIDSLWITRNPDKLGRLDRPVPLARR